MVRKFTSLDDPALIAILQQGGVGVIPTDTVYGLVAPTTYLLAIAKLYQIKHRDHPPGTLIAASIDQLANLGFDSADLKRAQFYWPNPLSVILNASDVPMSIRADRQSLPVRIPAHEPLTRLLRNVGPLMTTSANPPGLHTSSTIDEAIKYFGDQVDFYVDGGDLGERPPSTIIGFEDNGQIIVYRQGAVSIDH